MRVLEELVDRFLSARGIGVGTMLRTREWIPVVSRVRVTLLADAHLDEPITSAFTVDDILRRSAFDGEMECYVQRGTERVLLATARILHGSR